MNIVDLHGNKVDTENIEKPEQDLANQYILEDDVVLELGARYGSVSCVINAKLKNRKNQVVVEPDERVWDALEQNRENNQCEFHIVKGFISRKSLGLTNIDSWNGGYGATFIENNDTNIPSYSLEEIETKYNLHFNVLVADCEGFLERFFDENPGFYDSLRLILFEADYPEKCNYNKIKEILAEKGFCKILEGHQNVWIKSDGVNTATKKSPYSLHELKEKYDCNFLMVDCDELVLEVFFEENPRFYDQLKMILFESHSLEKYKYEKFIKILSEKGFHAKSEGTQMVWIKSCEH